MSVEEVPVGTAPAAAPKKSGRSWLAFCGIGCLVVILLCGAGAVITWFTAADSIKMAFEQGMMHIETVTMATESEEVIEKLGTGIVVEGTPFPETKEEGKQVTTIYKMDLKGSKASGVLNVEYQMEPGKPVERTVFNVVVDGETIDLMDSDVPDLDIDDGMDDDESASEESSAEESSSGEASTEDQ